MRGRGTDLASDPVSNKASSGARIGFGAPPKLTFLQVA